MTENCKRKSAPAVDSRETREVCLDVTSQEIPLADAARKYRVDARVTIRLGVVAKNAAAGGVRSGEAGPAGVGEATELELLRAESARAFPLGPGAGQR